jgi:hypothetical protein
LAREAKKEASRRKGHRYYRYNYKEIILKRKMEKESKKRMRETPRHPGQVLGSAWLTAPQTQSPPPLPPPHSKNEFIIIIDDDDNDDDDQEVIFAGTRQAPVVDNTAAPAVVDDAVVEEEEGEGMAWERSIAADIAYALSTVIRSPPPEEEDEEEVGEGEGMARERAAVADADIAAGP